MKNNLLIALSMSSLMYGSVVSANESMSAPGTTWHAVISAGGGVAGVTSIGQSKTFPIINAITDEYFVYSPQNGTKTKGLWEVFLGAEHPFYANWLVQAGIAYAQAGSYSVKGTFVQGADVPSANQYNYNFDVMTRQLLAQAKVIYPYNDKLYPYFLLGLGGSFNRASNYATSVPPFLTFTRMYANNTANAFAFRVGLGADVKITPHTRVGLAYRFSDLGSVQLGGATINNIRTPGTLSQSNLYANEVLAQFTYVI